MKRQDYDYDRNEQWKGQREAGIRDTVKRLNLALLMLGVFFPWPGTTRNIDMLYYFTLSCCAG